jgi:hypothetical protein
MRHRVKAPREICDFDAVPLVIGRNDGDSAQIVRRKIDRAIRRDFSEALLLQQLPKYRGIVET